MSKRMAAIRWISVRLLSIRSRFIRTGYQSSLDLFASLAPRKLNLLERVLMQDLTRRWLACLFLFVLHQASFASSQILYRVGFSVAESCDSPEPKASPFEACRTAHPGWDAYRISLSGGQGNLTDGAADGEYPIFGPACILEVMARPGVAYSRAVVAVCATSGVDIKKM